MPLLKAASNTGKYMQAAPAYEVRLHLSNQTDLYHASKVITGFFALASERVIRLITEKPFGGQSEPLALTFDLRRLSDSRKKRVVIDLRDQSNVFSNHLLDDCDIYLKRSFFERDLAQLSVSAGARVYPFGLNFGCTSTQSRRFLASRLWSQFLKPVLSSRGDLGSNIRTSLQRARIFFTLPDASEFNQDPNVPLEPAVTFQTRVWPPEEEIENLEDLNLQRVELVRALKTAFGPRFRGGLVPTPFARSRYPDLLANLPSRRSEYIRSSKRSLVAVYSIGLHGSTAFKLPEYLAASQCIVAEPMRNGLPSPLQSGTHYRMFTTPSECVEQCANLLEGSWEAEQMRVANHNYYMMEVEPRTHLLQCLERVFEL